MGTVVGFRAGLSTRTVIACGGIDHGYKIYDLIKMGVDAVQCYSVVAFRWMAAHAMRAELADALLTDGYKSLGEYDDRNPKPVKAV